MTHLCVKKHTTVGSVNELAAIRNAGILLIWPLGTELSEISTKIHIYIFIQENALEYGIYEMAAILARPQCVNKVNYDETIA